MIEKEGFIELSWGSLWYKTVGPSDLPPLLIVHGGPGYPSDYLWNLEALSDKHQVIFFDQIGCGRSSHTRDPKFCTIEYFVEELEAVIEKLNLKNIDLFGHSWGAMLVVEYLLTKPRDIKKVILASPCLSMNRWKKTTARYLAELPNNYGLLIREYEEYGKGLVQEYKIARTLYHETHECRMQPKPDLIKAANHGFNREVYLRMWGPNEYTVSGNLAEYDRTARLKELTLPTLFTCGRFDGASPEDVGHYKAQIAGSRLRIFEKSSHFPHWEEPTAYLECLQHFLNIPNK